MTTLTELDEMADLFKLNESELFPFCLTVYNVADFIQILKQSSMFMLWFWFLGRQVKIQAVCSAEYQTSILSEHRTNSSRARHCIFIKVQKSGF